MHPFVKWAGGKTQLLDEIVSLMPKNYNRYFEPFVGGGALFLKIAPRDSVINDFNSDLICAYRCMKDKDEYDKILEQLNYYQKHHSEQQYYQVREMDRGPNFNRLTPSQRAARLIYLNKSCFNGLYRVNAKGYFNVPSAKKKDVHCYDEKLFKEIAEYMQSTKCEILNGDFEKAVEDAKKGDFVYFDPPYDTWDEKESFTSYVKNPFGKEEQMRLANVYKQLSNRGVYVMLSNHNTSFIRELYKDFHIHVVNARRNINANGLGRGNVEEVLITNYV